MPRVLAAHLGSFGGVVVPSVRLSIDTVAHVVLPQAAAVLPDDILNDALVARNQVVLAPAGDLQ